MTNLGQEKYKDANGRDIAASQVDVLAAYQHVADGFYRWTCGRCHAEHADRACGWPISGQVIRCEQHTPAFGDRNETGCGAMNLLVRTNCGEIDVALAGMWRVPDRDKELERLKGVIELNEKAVLEVKRQLTALVNNALATWRLPLEDQKVHA
jgi:hypothetical protein